ncbi:DUF1810 domain-containing protein [Methylobacterium sp. WL116]|uniref:DUF1810 domain-containing protein n=1 Tax=Methylobacterium sp. WL116 TaxID=2603889 RepID=UPI0011C7A0E1|nr:DUF1810 domain-containing protein [Methylobacterium sp. WL116]
MPGLDCRPWRFFGASDPFDLNPFIDAQCGGYDQARQELTAGYKRSHWMWFVSPQTAGQGLSKIAQRYAIGTLVEVQAYLHHLVLGSRLRTYTAAVNQVTGRTAYEIFRSPDDMKFRSSMTLFAASNPRVPEFGSVLQRYFGGERDRRTLQLLDQTWGGKGNKPFMVWGTPGHVQATWEHTPQNGGNATLSRESTPQKRAAAITVASTGTRVRGFGGRLATSYRPHRAMCGVKDSQDGRSDVSTPRRSLVGFSALNASRSR